jgi:2,3-bisphosphoglycerate-independent phosphoglycerate mutase
MDKNTLEMILRVVDEISKPIKAVGDNFEKFAKGVNDQHKEIQKQTENTTKFFNGMQEDEFPGEERFMIPSPRVSSYDQQPEMSAIAIGDQVVKDIAAGSHDFIVLNLANADMVGHTGNEEATIIACETIDKVLGQISDAVLAVGGALIVTADHGNAEEVKNVANGGMDKEHSTNPVPCIIIAKELEGMKAPSGDVVGGDLSLTPPVGMLADIAPTVCALLDIQPAPEMTGRSLI